MSERHALEAERVALLDEHAAVVEMREAAERIEDTTLSALRRVEAQMARLDDDDGA